MTSSFSKKSFIFWAVRNQFVAVNSGENIDEEKSVSFIFRDLLIFLNRHTLCHIHSASKTCLQGLIFPILRHIKDTIPSAVTAELPRSVYFLFRY